MKVAIYLPSLMLGKGGAEKVACSVANLLCGDGAEVDVFHRPMDNAEPAYALDRDVRTVPSLILDDPDIGKMRGHYDVMLGFAMPPTYATIAQAAAVLDAPFVLQECTNPQRMVSRLHAARAEGVTSLQQTFWLRQAVMGHAAGLRFTVGSYLHSALPQLRQFAYAFPNSFDINLSTVSDYTKRSQKIVCVGGLKNDNKNGMALAHAFAESKVWKSGWTLEFVGTNGFEEDFNALNATLPQGAMVDRGTVSDAHDIYNDAQLLVIPSFEEGLPNVVVEAFSFGIPCIGFSDCPGTNYLIIPNERGQLVDRKTPGGLAAALKTLCKDKKTRARQNATVLDFAQSEFAFAKFQNNWRTLVENARAGKTNTGEIARPWAFGPDPIHRKMRAMVFAETTFGQSVSEIADGD